MAEDNFAMGGGRPMTTEEKTQLDQLVKQFIADETELPLTEMRDDAHLIEDLGLDSLLFLALFEELQARYDVSVDTRKLATLARRHPIETLGELKGLIEGIIEGRVGLD